MVSVKSPTWDRWWPGNVFISGGNPHLTSRFCGVVLGPTTISKMVSEQDFSLGSADKANPSFFLVCLVSSQLWEHNHRWQLPEPPT